MESHSPPLCFDSLSLEEEAAAQGGHDILDRGSSQTRLRSLVSVPGPVPPSPDLPGTQTAATLAASC